MINENYLNTVLKYCCSVTICHWYVTQPAWCEVLMDLAPVWPVFLWWLTVHVLIDHTRGKVTTSKLFTLFWWAVISWHTEDGCRGLLDTLSGWLNSVFKSPHCRASPAWLLQSSSVKMQKLVSSFRIDFILSHILMRLYFVEDNACKIFPIFSQCTADIRLVSLNGMSI